MSVDLWINRAEGRAPVLLCLPRVYDACRCHSSYQVFKLADPTSSSVAHGMCA